MYQLDHVVVGVRNLRAAAETYRTSLGFSVSEGGRHVGRGTHNMLIDFGGPYLELISVFDEHEAVTANRGRLVEYLRARSEGFVAYALRTNNICELAKRLRDAGLGATGPFSMRRVQADGREVAWRLLIPGGNQYRELWPFFIQWDIPPEGPVGSMVSDPGHANGARRMRELNVVVEDFERATQVYASVFGLPSLGARSPSSARYASYRLENCLVTLVTPTAPGALRETIDNEGDGPFKLTLAVTDADATRRWLWNRNLSDVSAKRHNSGLLIDDSAVDSARLILGR